jgi:flagellar biosynthesis chaperone FliJ
MKGTDREERALAQLLKVAKARGEDLQKHLAGLEAARAGAENSLHSLAEHVRTEERGAASTLDFGRFLKGAEEKRKALEATRSTLASEIASARETLLEAFAETKKLEHLLEITERAALVRERRADVALAADLTAMRRRG